VIGAGARAGAYYQSSAAKAASSETKASSSATKEKRCETDASA
jgi:hypothetical protein